MNKTKLYKPLNFPHKLICLRIAKISPYAILNIASIIRASI